MAAISHIRNRKEAKTRENIEQIIQKCSIPTGDVCSNTFVKLLRQSNVQLDQKEQMKLDKLADDKGFIKREAFIEFSKKSSAVKELGLRRSRSSTPIGRAEIDKAEVVFKSIDKDNSGFIDPEEMMKLTGNINKKQLNALMKKLDKDGDGQITLDEFRVLFTEMKMK